MTETQTLTAEQVAQSIRNPMFAKRDTLEEAFDYFFMVAKAVNDPNTIAWLQRLAGDIKAAIPHA